jgi:hypothetical protein
LLADFLVADFLAVVDVFGALALEALATGEDAVLEDMLIADEDCD